MTMRQYFVGFVFVVPLLVLSLGVAWSPVNWAFVVIVPVVLLGLYDMFQTAHTIRRLYPVLGHFRFMLESVRPEIQQYFVESETSGAPISREFRSLVYQRAKGDRDTRPFGTVFDVDREGYEWLNHSMRPIQLKGPLPRVKFGGDECLLHYMASPLNISAMSYGALGKNAIRALNRGAKIGSFFHNSGEGGLSSYHLEAGGDIVWQIGTGYFGCRDLKGGFDESMFRESSRLEVVKMIEIKLSQGAKPGHGGILPAAKLTEEVARIRHVPLGEDAISPAAHSAFTTPNELVQFIGKLRDLSGGKPVGFKLCVGTKEEFLAICKAMVESRSFPDFITVDGGEGGTGAAPMEMSNSVGMPLRDGLTFVNNALIGFGIRDRMRLIASGKMFTAFDVLRALALGADTVNSARGMMLALGCIQARLCNTNKCPTGITTQNKSRNRGLVVRDKATRVANFHHDTVAHLVELLAAAGLDNLDQVQPKHVNHRVHGTNVKSYAELYPRIMEGSLLNEHSLPAGWSEVWHAASSNQW